MSGEGFFRLGRRRGGIVSLLSLGLALLASVVPCDFAQAGSGTLSFVISRDVENLDPHSTGAWQSNMVRELIYDNLVDWDASGNPIPGIAVNWFVAAGGRSYSFHLRKDVRFTDGTPLDAAAVKASFDRLLSPGRRTAASGQLGFIASVVVDDPVTVTITTKAVNPLFLQYLGTGLAAIVSPADIARYGSAVIEHPVGSGPYVFVKWLTGDRLVLRKNPGYWGGDPGFDQIVMKAAPEASVRFTALTTGEVQLAELIAPTDYEAVTAKSGLKLIAGGGARFVYFNLATQHGPTADRRVRQAMNYAIDKHSIVDAILDGRGTVANSPVAPPNVGYHAVGAYDYDPAKAKRLLAEAGYDTSQTLQGVYPSGRPYAKEITEAVQAMLMQVGIKVEYTGDPDMTQYNALEKHLDRLNMAYTAFYPSVMDADSALFIRYRSGQFLNYNYSNRAVDALLDEGQKTFDRRRRDRIYAEIQDRIWQDAPFLALYYPTVNSAAAADLQGVKYYPNERLSVKWAFFSR